MAEWITREEVLELIRRERSRLEAALGRLSEERLTEPGSGGGEWSAKDLMAHVTHWEAVMFHRLGGPEPATRWAGSVDRTNAAVYERNRDRPLADVRRDFADVHRMLVERIESLSDDELNAVPRSDAGPGSGRLWIFTSEDEPNGESLAFGERVIWEYIACETWDHYPEHAEALELWAAER